MAKPQAATASAHQSLIPHVFAQEPAAPATPAVMDGDLLDLMQESLIVFDPYGRITRWNRASERIYGWTRAQAEGHTYEEVMGGRQWSAVEQIIEKGLDRPISMEVKLRLAGDEEVIVSAELSMRFDGLGRPVELVQTGVDVTAQRMEEISAAARQRHYSNVFQAVPASVWDIDFSKARRMALAWLQDAAVPPQQWFAERPHRIRELMRATFARDVNEQAIKLFGPCERSELLGDIERFWPEGSDADFADWVISALAGQSYFTRETRQRRHDGREFDALFTASFAPGAEGGCGLVVTIVDHSDVKRGQAAMRESEAFYADLFHGSAFSAWHLDATAAQAIYRSLRERGVTDFRAHAAENPTLITELMEAIKVVDVNDTSLKLFGAANRGEMVGKSITRYWPPDRLDTLIGSLEASFDGEPIFKGLSRMRTLAGNDIDVLFTRSASGALRSAGQLLLAIVDMTDKVQAQNALAELQAAFAHAARVSSLGELTASIAHEVNQPLAAITANGEAALRWLGRPTPDLEMLRGLTEDMIVDARRASDIVAHVRSMASPQVGTYRTLSLGSLVGEALTLLGSEMKRFGVLATCDLGEGLPQVSGDPIQLQQVVVNLVLNALQAMEGMHGARLVLRTRADVEGIALTVEDNGPGVPAENLEKLFGVFFTTKTDGMGIGLAICRSIVEAHGGAISVSNLSPTGVRFTVLLPPAETEAVGA